MKTNSGPWCPVSGVCKILYINVHGLARNNSDLTMASSRFDILVCSETKVSDMRHVSELLIQRFGCPVLLCWGRMHGASDAKKNVFFC